MRLSDQFTVNISNEDQVFEHLMSCDSVFVARLSQKVNITDYAKKLVRCADRFEIWRDSKLVGLVAVYFNNTQKNVAFFTNISVMSGWRSNGIATQLMQECIARARRHGFSKMQLEVDYDNVAAAHLYSKLGFVIDHIRNETVTMYLLISEESKF